MVDDTSVISAWTGKTYDYRQRFNTAEVPRPEGERRLLQEARRDVGQADKVAFIISVFEGAVLRSHICNVTVSGVEPAPETATANFLQTLKEKEYIYVDAW